MTTARAVLAKPEPCIPWTGLRNCGCNHTVSPHFARPTLPLLENTLNSYHKSRELSFQLLKGRLAHFPVDSSKRIKLFCSFSSAYRTSVECYKAPLRVLDGFYLGSIAAGFISRKEKSWMRRCVKTNIIYYLPCTYLHVYIRQLSKAALCVHTLIKS